MISTLWSGLAVGAVFVLAALQFDLIHTATGVFNLGQSGILVIGSLTASTLLVTHHVAWWVVLLVLAVGCALLGVLQEFVAVRPLRRSGGLESHTWVVTTLGAGILLQGIAFLIWGSDPRSVPFPFFGEAHTVLGGRVQPVQLAAIALALVAALALRTFLRRTRVGLSTVATAVDRDLAILRGINASRVSVVAFAVAGGFVGVSALVVAPITFASYDMGEAVLVLAFAALAIGGFGSQLGTVVGGFAIGLVQAFSAYLVGPEIGPVLVLALLLVVLMIRPQGLFSASRLRSI